VISVSAPSSGFSFLHESLKTLFPFFTGYSPQESGLFFYFWILPFRGREPLTELIRMELADPDLGA